MFMVRLIFSLILVSGLLVYSPAAADLLSRTVVSTRSPSTTAEGLLVRIQGWPTTLTSSPVSDTLSSSAQAATALLQSAGLHWQENLPVPNWSRWSGPFDAATSRVVAAGLLSKLRKISPDGYIQPNFHYHPLGSDPDFGNQWYLLNNGQTLPNPSDPADGNDGGVEVDPGIINMDINAWEAWANTTGSAEVVVAVLDTGVATDHPDLVGVLAENGAESVLPNGIDNDSNGFVDDRDGFDFCDGDADPDDNLGHGTGVAAVIAAVRENGVGMAGLASGVRILPIRFLGPEQGSGPDCNTTVAAIKGIHYAQARQVDVLNMSFGGPDPDPALQDALIAAQQSGIILITAAGNEAVNNDNTPSYPASYKLASMITVAAHTNSDHLSSFSNYGSTVDIAAPGSSIYTADAPARNRFPHRNPDDLSAADGPFKQLPSGADFSLDRLGHWGIASLTTGERVIILDAARAFSETGGYRADSEGTWTSAAFSISTSTQLRMFIDLELAPNDKILLELSGDGGTSWRTLRTLTGRGSLELSETLSVVWSGISSARIKIRPLINTGSSTGRPGGVWIGAIQLWERSLPMQATLPLHRFTQGTSLAAPLVAATAALIRSQAKAIPNTLVVQRILTAAAGLGDSGVIASNRRLDAGQATRTLPFLYFTGDEGFAHDGANPDELTVRQPVELRVGYMDPQNWALPRSVTAFVDSPQGSTTTTMTVLTGSQSTGLSYNSTLSAVTEGTLTYQFFATDSRGRQVRGPTGLIQVNPPPPSTDTTDANLATDGVKDASGCSCQLVDGRLVYGSGDGWLTALVVAFMPLWWNRRRRL